MKKKEQMNDELKEVLDAFALGFCFFGLMGCGLGLLIMATDGYLNLVHFIRLGMGTAGTGMLGGIFLVYLHANTDNGDESENEEEVETESDDTKHVTESP